jgi:glutamate racemase
VLAANGQALAGIEKVIRAASPTAKVFGMCSMPLVEAIEERTALSTVWEVHHIATVVKLATALGVDAILLACTHFTVLAERIEHESGIAVVDTASILVRDAAAS